MPREYWEIDAAKLSSEVTQLQSETLGLPPGFIAGGRIYLNDSLQIIVEPIIANVSGRQVRIKEQTIINEEHWETIGIDKLNDKWYYLYLGEEGIFAIHHIEPVWSNEYFAFYHPNYDRWLGLAKFYIDSNTIITSLSTIYDLHASSVTAEKIEAGAVTVDKLAAAEIATMLLYATSAVIIGQDYAGTPPAGSQRVVCDDNELKLEEYDGAAWQAIFRIGGDDMLKWYLQARGLIKTGADISGLEIGDRAPSGSKIFDFENDVLDKADVDHWEAKLNLSYNPNFKFGTKALTHTAGKTAVLRDEAALGITASDFGMSAWHYKPTLTKNQLLWGVVKDGTWTSRTSASARQWFSVCWSPEKGLFCAVAYDGLIATQVMTSPDGTNWTSRTSASAQQWTSVCWSPEKGLFCAVAYDGAVGVQVMTSADGITWTSRTSASAQLWRSVCWSPELGLFCAVAVGGAVGVQVMTSPDGITWTSRTSASSRNWSSICWSSELNLFCAVAYDGLVATQIMTSPDGINWTSRTSSSAEAWRSVCWSPELRLFCAVASSTIPGNQVMTSLDGITWTSRVSASAQSWLSVCWSPELGLFCAVASNGVVGVQVMTSPDGTTWTSRTSASAQLWYSVCWSPQLSLFCATAINGLVAAQVMTSALSGMRLYATSTGYRLIVGASTPIQDRVATADQWHHVGITSRDVAGQKKWGLAVDAWSTEVNIAAYPVAAGSRLLVNLSNGERLDDMAALPASALLSLAKMLTHYASGQPWVDASTGIDYLLDLIIMAKSGGAIRMLSPTTYYAPVVSEPSGGTWHKVANPPTGWLASKTTGWTADSFSGGLEVDFSTVVPAGTKAVSIVIRSLSAAGDTYHRKSGDTNISNTPNASGEHSHRAVTYVGSIYAADIITVWLSTDYKAQFAVTDINQDIYIAYPIAYLL